MELLIKAKFCTQRLHKDFKTWLRIFYLKTFDKGLALKLASADSFLVLGHYQVISGRLLVNSGSSLVSFYTVPAPFLYVLVLVSTKLSLLIVARLTNDFFFLDKNWGEKEKNVTFEKPPLLRQKKAWDVKAMICKPKIYFNSRQ